MIGQVDMKFRLWLLVEIIWNDLNWKNRIFSKQWALSYNGFWAVFSETFVPVQLKGFRLFARLSLSLPASIDESIPANDVRKIRGQIPICPNVILHTKAKKIAIVASKFNEMIDRFYSGKVTLNVLF